MECLNKKSKNIECQMKHKNDGLVVSLSLFLCVIRFLALSLSFNSFSLSFNLFLSFNLSVILFYLILYLCLGASVTLS